jgi:hypothetical protein
MKVLLAFVLAGSSALAQTPNPASPLTQFNLELTKDEVLKITSDQYDLRQVYKRIQDAGAKLDEAAKKLPEYKDLTDAQAQRDIKMNEVKESAKQIIHAHNMDGKVWFDPNQGFLDHDPEAAKGQPALPPVQQKAKK